MKTIMNSGVSKITKIPSDGLNFYYKTKIFKCFSEKIMGGIGLRRRV